MRRAEVTVKANGKSIRLVSATYHLPTTVGNVQIDCSVTNGYNSNGQAEAWHLEKGRAAAALAGRFVVDSVGQVRAPCFASVGK